MGFSDLKFRWHKESFDLYDVEFLCSIELQHLNNDGDWVERAPYFIGIFSDTEEKKKKENMEYENPSNVKYSKPRRTLRAKAKYSEDSYNAMYLSVPEDKQSADSRETRIEYFDFLLHETGTDDLGSIVKSGCFGYIDDDSDIPTKGGPFAEFYAPTDVFDDIERLSSQENIQLHVSINRKGWQWTGPIGDGQIYLDTENRELAEFAGLTVSRKIACFETIGLHEEVNKIGDNYSHNAIEANMHIFNKLSEIVGYTESIKWAIWIAALGIIFLAIKSF